MRIALLAMAGAALVPQAIGAAPLAQGSVEDLSEGFDLVRDRARVPRTEVAIARSVAEELRLLTAAQRSGPGDITTKAELLKQIEQAYGSGAVPISENDFVRRLLRAMIRATGEDGSVITIAADGTADWGAEEEAVETPKFDHQLLDGIHYLKLGALDDAGLTELRSVLNRTGQNARIILDLRGSPGGLLDSSVMVADLFIAEGEIGSQGLGRDAWDKERFFARQGDPGENASLIVLIDQKTARGAEFAAAALQHSRRATLMGQPTMGNGLIHTIVVLKSRQRAMKLPTSMLLTADNKPLSGNPVRPDVLISAEEAVDSALVAARTSLSHVK